MTDIDFSKFEGHTPAGEWGYEDPSDACCGSPCTQDGCHENHATGMFIVTGPPVDDGWPPSRYLNEADAALIASAPDLLAQLAERDATIAALTRKIEELETTLSDYEPGSGEFERVRVIGYGNESARLATEAAGEPSEWDIYTKQMVEIAEYADWEIRDYRRDLEKVRRYAESGVHHAVIQAAATNALSPVRRNFLPPPPVTDEGK